MGRIQIIDGLRGYFIVFMLINHLTFTGGYMLLYFNHAQLGFVEDAQGFVFLSGLLAGMVYTRKMVRGGFAAGARALWRRAGELYAYAIGSILTILVLREILPGAPHIWDNWLGAIGRGGAGAHIEAALLLYQATFLDILPQYIVYMLAAPGVIWLVLRGKWAAVLTGSLLLWLAVQTGLHLPLAAAIDGGLGHISAHAGMRVPFNVLAWQLLFMSAMTIGVLLAQGRIEVRRFFDPERPTLAGMLAACLVFFLVFRLGFTFDVVPDAVAQKFRMLENRSCFSLIFLVNFAMAGYVLAWLLIAGPLAADRRVRRIANALTWLFDRPFLRLLGRHSLQIYAWHVVLVYLVYWLDRYHGPFDELTKTAIAIAGVLLLSLPALYRERRSAAQVAGRPAGGGAKA